MVGKKLVQLAVLVLGGWLVFAQEEVSGQQYTIAIVTGETVNVRGGPSSSAGVVDSILKGAVALVHETSGSWARISYKQNSNGELKSGWIAAQFLEVVRGRGGNGDSYTTEYGANFTLRVDDTDFDCREGYEGYDRCTVEVDVSVSSDYNGFGEPSIEIDCEVVLQAFDAEGYGSRKRDSESGTVFGREGSDFIEIDIRLTSYEPIVRVKLDDVECTISSVYG